MQAALFIFIFVLHSALTIIAIGIWRLLKCIDVHTKCMCATTFGKFPIAMYVDFCIEEGWKNGGATGCFTLDELYCDTQVCTCH